MNKRVAIIGSGIAGLTCAWLLREKYDVSLYEAND
ncbi:MAG: FAD-dependent oxidoreductase, partial [Pseudomonadota bacterium]|nr:FAD-dependent oxidoreductase [Pseudomonadota bacterium]